MFESMVITGSRSRGMRLSCRTFLRRNSMGVSKGTFMQSTNDGKATQVAPVGPGGGRCYPRPTRAVTNQMATGITSAPSRK